MPMVPSFNGNIPRVRDNGGSGMVPAQVITPRTDYASVMKEALKPITDTAQTVQEVLKINHARTVKAESDDAENMVIQTINSYMNDPENGYLTKQGKNAMDGFQPTVEKMQADIQKIVGQLQPATRQAIESRINDRMVNAIGQAQRWNTQQTQKYHIDSSRARVETLLDDGANHYADATYLAKTWASIENELNYQTADFSGVPPEAAKQMKDQTFALFQSKRFAVWAQDDPVMAFAAFRNEKKNIDPDIAQKIENSLFGQSRDLLAYGLANAPLKYGEDGKLVNAKWMDDPRAKTGDAFIDSLPPDQHLSVVAKAMSLRRAMTGELRNSMKLETTNSLARVLTTGQDDNPLTLGQFVEVYGPKDGQKNYDQYLMDFDYNQTMYDFKSMSNEDMRSLLKAEKPAVESDNYAKEYKYWEGKVKAAAEIQKQRTADPVGYAIENELYAYKPLNFGNMSELTDQLLTRANNIDTMSRDWGVPKSIISKSEATQLVSALDNGDIDTKIGLLKTITDIAGSDGVAALYNQLRDSNENYATAAAGFDEPLGDSNITVGEASLRGADYLEKKQVKLDDSEQVGVTAQVAELLGDDNDYEGVYSGPNAGKANSATISLVKNLTAYYQKNGGSIQDAMEKGIGVVTPYNGKKIIMPGGTRNTWYSDDFDDAIIQKAKDVRQGKLGKGFYKGTSFDNGAYMESGDFADLLSDLKLQTYGRRGNAMQYLVMYNDDYIYDEKRKPLVLEIGG